MQIQDALKNPDYKKIWERVIRNRHPEAKSLEEALEEEQEHSDCLIYVENGDILATIGELSINCKLIEYKRNKIKYFCIGRPITLEDILLLFTPNDAIEHHHAFGAVFPNANGSIFEFVRSEFAFNAPDWSAGCDRLAEWFLTEPLHKQLDSTWKVITIELTDLERRIN
jgi:hypothetical protein